MTKVTKPTPVKENTRSSEALEASQSRVLRKINGDIEAAEEKQTQLQNSINSTQGELEGIESRTLVASKKETGLNKEIERLTDERTKAEKALASSLEDVKKAEEVSQVDTDELKDVKESIEKAKEQRIDLINDATDKAKKIVDDAEAEAKSIKNRLVGIEKKITVLTTDADEIETTKTALNDEVKRLEGQEKTHLTNLEELEVTTEAAVADLAAAKDIVKSEKATIKTLSKKREGIEAKAKEADTNRVNLERDIVKLKGDKDEAEKEANLSNAQRIAMAKRKTHLDQREAHIAAQFKSGGITYTPFSPQ